MRLEAVDNGKSENSKDLHGIAKALIVGFSWSYAEIYEKQKRQQLLEKNDPNSDPSIQSPSKHS